MVIFRVLLLGVFVALSGWTNAAELNFSRISQSASVLDVSISISGLESEASPSLSVFDLDIGFDDTQLAYRGSIFGDPVLGDQLDVYSLGANFTGAELSGPGKLNVYELSLDTAENLNDLQVDSFTLAVLTFDVLSAKSSQLEVFVNSLGDADGNPLFADSNAVVVTTVPLPTAIWLFGTVVIGITFNRKCKIH